MTNDTSTDATRDLTAIEKDLLLALVRHHMGQDLRRVVMETLPHAYNAWVGHDIMVTAQRSALDAQGYTR